MYSQFVDFVHSMYSGSNGQVALHAPVFLGNEKKYLADCIDSTFVSYVGKYVTQFEDMMAAFTGAKFAVAVVNGTAALQIALEVAGVKDGDEVITQPLTFVATANAIVHAGARPVFVDVDRDTMGMSARKLSDFLRDHCEMRGRSCINRISGRTVSAVLPMHTFGHPCRIDEIIEAVRPYGLVVIEDAAEALGSLFKGRHAGTFGRAGVLSFNGNKTITTGGGGMILTDDESFAARARHITTTGKVPHRWEYVHDMAAYNFRLTNINAALGVAQMETLEMIVKNKRETATRYQDFFSRTGMQFVREPDGAYSNYWLNAVLCADRNERDAFLEYTNGHGVVTRPAWRLMDRLEMYSGCVKGDLENARMLEDRLVNIPSGYRE